MKYIPLTQGRQYIPGIYIIETPSGKQYVGSAVSLRTRFMTHRFMLNKNKHDNPRLQNYFNKYGSESLTFRVVEICEQGSLLSREQYYIDTANPFFNICRTAGGTYGLKPWLGKKHTEETKLKIKQTNLETFAKRPKKTKPIKLTKEENIRRFADLNKTEESKKRISEFHKGNSYWLGRKHKPETIENRIGALNPNSKKVYCKELDKTFNTCKDAYMFFGIGRSAVGNSIRKGWKIRGKYTMNYVS